MMLGVSAVMYSGTFYARVCKLNASSQYQSKDRFNISNRTIYCVLFLDDEVQVKREQKRVAMHEYYEKHGGGDHH